MPGNSNDQFDFIDNPGGPSVTMGELTEWAILEQDFDQGGHASGEPTPRAGLPNIGLYDGQQGDLFTTVDYLADVLGYL